MWRTLSGLSLIFVAFLFLYLSVMAIFIFSPGLFAAFLPGVAAPLGAILTFAGAVLLTRRILRKSDRILFDDETERATRLMAERPPREELDWVAQQAQLARNKRWAYLRRTRQFDLLAKLEAEETEQAEKSEQADAASKVT